MIAVVLAGGPPDAVSAFDATLPNKAFVPIAGVPLVARVIASLHATPEVTRIIVVAPLAAHAWPALSAADERRADGLRMIESLESGLAELDPDEALVISASDLPVLPPAAVSDAIAQARARDLDLAYTIVEAGDHRARYPQVPHTWARMRDGRFCGGGVVILKPRIMPGLRTLLDDLGAVRKSPLRLAALFGWDIASRFVLGALSIAAAERRASTLVGGAVGAIRSRYPGIAVNVDRPGDIALAEGVASGDPDGFDQAVAKSP